MAILPFQWCWQDLIPVMSLFFCVLMGTTVKCYLVISLFTKWLFSALMPAEQCILPDESSNTSLSFKEPERIVGQWG